MKMIKLAWAVILTLIATSGSLLHSQTIGDNLARYADNFMPERASIHFDKSRYAMGDTVWFKSYLLNELLPADQSKTFYVDFIDDKGILLQHTVTPLIDAMAHGQYDIPSTYAGEYIRVRAYTRWMLNFDTAFIYSRDLPILTRSASSVKQAPAVSSITFFPEGGDAVAGLVNKIAFKANDQWGRPIKTKGVVTASNGMVVDSLRPQHDGMGFFYLTPEPGLTYSARWKDEKDVERTTALPQIKSQGAVLQVVLAGKNRQFQVNYKDEFKKANDTIHIIGTMYQREAFRVTKLTELAGVKGTIPTKDLPSGILTITLFDNRWIPVAERITYINNEEYQFNTTFDVEHWGLSKRARNEVKLTIPDSMVANLSISVTDVAIGADSARTLVSDLLLSSELKGEVYNPAYYFKTNNDKTNRNLDLVMLTHGWRRFKWNEIVSGKFSKLPYAHDTSYLSVSGNLMGVSPGQIGNGAGIVVMLKTKQANVGQVLMIPVLPDGSFNDPTAILFDTAQIYYQFQNKGLADASAQFMTNRLRVPAIKKPELNRFGGWPDTTGNYLQLLLANQANSYAEQFRMKTLEGVTVKSRGKTPIQLLDEKYTSGLFRGDAQQFDLVNDVFASSAQNIFTYLQGKVAGLQITGSGSNVSLQWRGGVPSLYLDETPIDVSFLTSLNTNDVAYVKVFRPPFMGTAGGGANGAIVVYTKKGDDRKETSKGLNSTRIEGYTISRDFYSPRYFGAATATDEKDVRTTLYWNPSVPMGPGKKNVVLSFYNNDVSNAFRVIIEGMSADGRLTHLETIME